MNLPNKLTILRIILIPVFMALFFIKALPYNFLFACIIFCLAAITDFLDGYIARKQNLVTNLGKFLDPIADKILVAAALIIMLVPVGDFAILPWYASIAVAIILARELMVSGFRIVAASKGMVLAADKSGKIKTFLQDIAIIVLLVGASFDAGAYSVTNIIGLCLLGVATILTIISGIEYLVKNKSVLKDEDTKEEQVKE
jgi:CDP-diacylglycerol--glycerol-3-phosphate 3-phosphatidyltransferase